MASIVQGCIFSMKLRKIVIDPETVLWYSGGGIDYGLNQLGQLEPSGRKPVGCFIYACIFLPFCKNNHLQKLRIIFHITACNNRRYAV